VAFTAAAALAASCVGSGTRQHASAPTTYDSAGVTIVLSDAAPDLDSTSWVIDSVPALVIGTAAGGKAHMLSGLAGFLRQSDGTIVIADTQTEELRFFDSTGAHIATTGGKGFGPGEYVNLYRLLRANGDSLFLIDYEGLRAHRLDERGAEIRNFRPRVAGNARHQFSAPSGIGLVGGGSMLVRDYMPVCARSRPEGRTSRGYCEDSARVHRLSEDGRIVADYGIIHSDRELTLTGPNGEYVGFDGCKMPVRIQPHD
jgi:hypothetical protein